MKYQNKSEVIGALRLMLTAENESGCDELFNAAIFYLTGDTLTLEEIALVSDGNKISAIKSVRARIPGMTLRRAKDIVDAQAAGIGSRP